MAHGREDFTYTSEVDVIAQSLAALTASITLIAQTVGVYLQPEWAAKEGIDKTITTVGANKAWESVIYTTYVVPAGKTLYLLFLSCWSTATLAADADNNQITAIAIENLTEFTTPVIAGGNGGLNFYLPVPVVITEGQTVRIQQYNQANHNCDMRFTAWGYEI